MTGSAYITPSVGDEVIETFCSMHPESLDTGLYLFFDELQEMQNWGAWLRRIVDTTKATIYVTGSSSKMLYKRNFHRNFEDRALDFELLPFSFREFVRARGIAESELLSRNEAAGYSTKERLMLSAALISYLEEGGFPAIEGLPTPQRVTLLQSYVQRVVSRDVVERYDIARPRVASALARRLLGSNGKPLSIRKMENELRSAGLATSRVLLGDLLEYFEDAYLVFRMKDFSMSLKESTTSTSKIYAIDPGLAAASSMASARDDGQRLENAVYLELRRRTAGYTSRRHIVMPYQGTWL